MNLNGTNIFIASFFLWKKQTAGYVQNYRATTVNKFKDFLWYLRFWAKRTSMCYFSLLKVVFYLFMMNFGYCFSYITKKNEEKKTIFQLNRSVGIGATLYANFWASVYWIQVFRTSFCFGYCYLSVFSPYKTRSNWRHLFQECLHLTDSVYNSCVDRSWLFCFYFVPKFANWNWKHILAHMQHYHELYFFWIRQLTHM